MSSLGIFDKETKTYKKVAGTAEAAAVDDALSSTSTNPVQNKVVTSHLTDLKYGEVAGGKNLLNPNKTIIGELVEGIVDYSGEKYISDYIPIKSETSYSISNCTQGSNGVAWYTSDKTYISRSFTTHVISPSNASYVRIEYTDNINAQLEEGSTATSYEPYIPSVKMLEEENAQQSTEMMDIKMLGWAVPRECPIQNEVNGNQFVQKVGRVDLGSLNWNLREDGYFENELLTSLPVGTTPDEDKEYAIYSNLYKSSSWDVVVNSNTKDMVITLYKFYTWTYATIAIRNKKYTDAESFKQAMQGQYLYYELATPITKTIDGNEIGETVSDVRKETTVNLYNPMLKTHETDGVTCTQNVDVNGNPDGTYTINGTSTKDRWISFANVTLNPGEYKFIATENNVRLNNLCVSLNSTSIATPGDIFTIQSKSLCNIGLSTYDKTFNNVILKPMLTTNLSATYDDFVPYTGDTGKLNGDVAALKAEVANNKTTVDAAMSDLESRIVALESKLG